MNPYQITVIDRNHKRTRYIALAHCWFEAWLNAANDYGLAALVTIKPYRAGSA